MARLAARLHVAEEGAAGIEMRVRVDRIVPAPDVGVILFERARSAADAGVAEQDAHRPEVARLRARGGPALFAGDVELEAKRVGRSEEHTSELQSLMRISYAVFCLKK